MRAAAGLLAVAGVLALGATGCGGGSSESSSDSTTAGAGSSQSSPGSVEISDFKFMPPDIDVPAGTEIMWTNDDNSSHTATAQDGSFDTGTLDQGDSKTVTLDKPGTYDYVCEFHPFMKGTVTVSGS